MNNRLRKTAQFCLTHLVMSRCLMLDYCLLPQNTLKKHLFEQNKKVESFHCTYAIIKISISFSQKEKVKIKS